MKWSKWCITVLVPILFSGLSCSHMQISIVSWDTCPPLSDTKEEADQKMSIAERSPHFVLLLCKCQERGLGSLYASLIFSSTRVVGETEKEPQYLQGGTTFQIVVTCVVHAWLIESPSWENRTEPVLLLSSWKCREKSAFSSHVRLINENKGAWMAIIIRDSPQVFRAVWRIAQKTEWNHVLLPWIFNEFLFFCLRALVLSSPTAAVSGLHSPIAVLVAYILSVVLKQTNSAKFLISYVIFCRYCESGLTVHVHSLPYFPNHMKELPWLLIQEVKLGFLTTQHSCGFPCVFLVTVVQGQAYLP